jgi:hypothetical protein
MVDSYSREHLMGYLNNPTRHGLWDLTITIDNPDAFHAGLVKRDAVFKDYPPLPSWLVGICLSQLATVIAGKEDPDASFMRRVGLIQDDVRYIRRSSSRRGFPSYAPRVKLSTRKKKTKESLYAQEIEKMRELFPGLRNVISDSGYDFLSTTKPKHFSLWLGSRNRNQIEVLSIDKHTLEDLQKMIALLISNAGTSSSDQLSKIYTPEYKMFIPYFHALFLASNSFSISNNPDITREISSALTEIFEGKPDGAIRCSGLAMDFLLEEVYETCFREKAPDKPLGELFESIRTKATQILEGDRPADSILPENEEFARLAEVIKVEGNSSAGACASAARFAIHQNKEIGKRLEKIEHKLQIGKKSPHPFFSQSMLDSVYKATDLRNAGSHRGREELTPFHTAMCMRGVVNLLSWWEFQRGNLPDWDADLKTIIKGLSQTGPSYHI